MDFEKPLNIKTRNRALLGALLGPVITIPLTATLLPDPIAMFSVVGGVLLWAPSIIILLIRLDYKIQPKGSQNFLKFDRNFLI